MVDSYQPLPDTQWQVIAPLLPVHRKRCHCLRLIIDAVCYICHTGGAVCTMALSPGPPCITTSAAGNAAASGLFDRCAQLGRPPGRWPAGYPSLVYLDRQSVRLASRIFEHRELGGGKHVNRRKRQILTKMQGRILACRVYAANGRDGVEALQLLPARPA